ncbi:DnaN DNA polymerase sliding clamp subunit (PCNA homolog) [uncultured Caudovirales phage]|uniref:DnaN DNA polymerase sliding clamp subunit (PCNA homolog) n=1 Tax=uncultured Caudovirales phage TaxID=2100421 RepID=A0A6J5RGE3_9CAUD|nr:DnaN DNA polymerase sliding clamp subunit (PCNA homolog) [uncultured Caudovirales phage]
MKLSIERSTLLNAIKGMKRIAKRNIYTPILSNALLIARDSRLHVNVTDRDIEISKSLVADVECQGKITVSLRELYDIAKGLDKYAVLEMEAVDTKLLLRSGGSMFSLDCLPVADFPFMSSGGPVEDFVIPARELLRLINHTKFAINNRDNRYYLNGLFIHTVKSGDKNVLRAVATDGHRVARVDTELAAGMGEIPGVIIPRATAVELSKSLAKIKGDVTVTLEGGTIIFEFDHTFIKSTLVDGVYPDYSRVIPSGNGNDKSLIVNAKTISQAAKRVSGKKEEQIKLNISKGKIVISINNGVEVLEALEAGYDSDAIEASINPRYLIENMDVIDGDVRFLFTGNPRDPVLINGINDPSALYVLMPTRG